MSILKNAVLVAVTAIVVVWLPKFLHKEPPVIVEGFVAKGFEEVKEKFRENFETGLEPRDGGTALTVYYKGSKVVDIWGGYADVDQPWREETMSVFYSTTKGIAAICLAMLADRGHLDYEKPVAHYWPEFAQKGKGKITVRQLLNHQAGLVLAKEPGLSFDLLRDVAKAGEVMAASEPLWEVDGKTHGYHSITFGPLTNELLRRVDPAHRTMGRFFAEELAKPFGLDFYIGLPLEENYRVAKISNPPESTSLVSMIAAGLTSSTNRQGILHMLRDNLVQRSMDNGGLSGAGGVNNPYNRQVELPSALGIGTARAVAKLYGILAAGGVDATTKKSVMGKAAIEKLLTSAPPTIDVTLGIPLAFNLGVTGTEMIDGVVMYGHPGAGGQLGFADPKRQIGIGFQTNSMSPYFVPKDDPRASTLIETLYECIDKLEKK